MRIKQIKVAFTAAVIAFSQIGNVSFAAENLTNGLEDLKSNLGYEGKNAIIDVTVLNDYSDSTQKVNGMLSLKRFNDKMGMQYDGGTNCVIKKNIDPLPTDGVITVTLKSQTNTGNGTRIKLMSGEDVVADVVIGDMEGKTRINDFLTGSVRGGGWGWHNNSEYWCTEEIILNYDTNRISRHFVRVGMQDWGSYLYNDDGTVAGEVTVDEVQNPASDLTKLGVPITIDGSESKGAIDSIELSPCNASKPESETNRDVLYSDANKPNRYWNIDKVSVAVDGVEVLNDDFTEDKPLYDYGWSFANKTGYASLSGNDITFIKESDNEFSPLLYAPLENIEISGNFSLSMRASAFRKSADGESITAAKIKAGLYSSADKKDIFIASAEITDETELIISGNTYSGVLELLKRDGNDLVTLDDFKQDGEFNFDTLVIGGETEDVPNDNECIVLKLSDLLLYAEEFRLADCDASGRTDVRTDGEIKITFTDNVYEKSTEFIKTYFGDEEVKSEAFVSENDKNTVIIKYPFGLLYNAGYEIRAEKGLKSNVGMNVEASSVLFRTEAFPVSLISEAADAASGRASVRIKNDTGFDQNYMIIAASYGADGLLTGVVSENVTVSDGENDYEIAGLKENANSYKIMIWRSMTDLTSVN